MPTHLIPHDILNCEGPLITLCFTEAQTEAHKAEEGAQGQPAKAGIGIQAMVRPTPEPVLLAAKTAEVPCPSNILGLSEYWGIKKTINKPSQM